MKISELGMISGFQDSKLKKILIVAFLAIGVLAVLLSRQYLYSVSLKPVLLFLVFVFIYDLVPGFALLRLLGLRFDSKITKYPVAFFFGMALVFAEYFICSLLGHGGAVAIVSPVVTAALIMAAIKKHGVNKAVIREYVPTFKEADAGFVLFVVLIFALSVVTLRSLYAGSLYTGQLAIYQDFVWHMGNIDMLASGLPPLDPRTDGIIFYYHFFQEYFYAICQHVTGIRSDLFIMTTPPYMISLVFGTSTYALIREFTSKKRMTSVYCLAMLLPGYILPIYSTGLIEWFDSHVLDNVNSVGVSISALMTFFILFKYGSRVRYTVPFIIGMCVLIMLTSGLKSPFGALIVVGMIALLIVNSLVNKKIDFRLSLATLATSISAMMIYLYVVAGTQYGPELDRELDYEFGLKNGSIDVIHNRLGIILPENAGTALILTLAYVFVGYGFFAFPALASLITCVTRYLKGRQTELEPPISMIATIFFGIAVYVLISFSGMGQGYFIFATFPLAMLLAFMWLEGKKRKRFINRAITAIFLIGLASSIVHFGINNVHGLVDMKATFEYRKPVYSSLAVDGENAFSRREREAMWWIAKNTEDDALFATNARTIALDPPVFKHFYYSSYSERRFYLEGSEFGDLRHHPDKLAHMTAANDAMFGADDGLRTKTAKENGVDYLVVSKRLLPDPGFGGEGIEEVFSNKDVVIYKVL